MKSDKLNEFLSSCNKLETLDCYYWNNNIIGTQFDINYNSLQEEVLNEITTNLYSLQSNQANLYFNQLFQTIEDFILKSDLYNTPTFCKYAKIEYERHLLAIWKEEDFNFFLEGNFNDIFNEILEERIKSRIDLINSLKLKIEKIKSIYFDGMNKEFKPSIDTIDKIDIDKTKTSTTKESIEIDELNKIKEDINSVINDRIKWKGKPSQFGHLIIELIGKGWIELPRKSYNKSAEFLMNLFDIDTTKGNLSKELNSNETAGNSLTPDSQDFFKVKENKKIK